MGRNGYGRRKGNKDYDADKKKAEAARARKRFAVLAVIIVTLAGTLGGILYITANSPSHEGYQPTTPVVLVQPPQGQDSVVSDVAIPVSEVTTDAKFYTYGSSGVTVRFFLAKGSDDRIHAAADACDFCYAQKKGYKQAGDQMQCNNCGQQFSINSVGTSNTAGGCWPSYLHMRIDGDSVLIPKSNQDSKASMFR